ncbi:MAG: hypothetical protein CMH70_00290 [Nitrosomonadaceae bacterium]|nr:hypothetical protein [Nitrosomonadaceae bacterium]|tara:strand:- start:2833 stop:4320 length:1488 start_codon:yes stop_codon:yes gene_type:complete
MQILSRLKSIDSNSKNYWFYSLFFLLVFSVLILFRYPGFVLEPRIWGEDSVYIETFLHASVWWEGFDALIYPSYYLVFTRFAGFLTTFVGLESIAAVVTWFGFLILILPILILFMTDCKYWDSLQKKIILSLFFVFSCSTGEVWLTSTNLGFILPIISFLILLDDNLESKLKRILYCILLSCAVLNGPITLIMSPFFLLRFFQTRNKQFLNYCLILFFLGLVHILYFAVSTNAGVSSPSRFSEGRDLVKSLIHIVSSNLIFPLFGYFLSIIFRVGTGTIYSGLENSPYLGALEKIFPGHLGEWIISIVNVLVSMNMFIIVLGGMILILIFYNEFKKSNYEEKVYFLSLFLYLSIALGLLSLKGQSGFRYSYVTGFILLFYLYQRVSFNVAKARNMLVKVLLIFSISVGILEYYPRTISFTPSVLIGESTSWPDWENEVGLWRKDNSYLPKVWPYIKKTGGIWPERQAVWVIDLNRPKNWEESGRKKFSEELLKLF